MIVLLLFFGSGATALVYEVVWSKYLALLFGSTIQAQSVVLAVFMGGLALGNKLFGRRADRTRRPLVIYGGIEIAIGLYAFFFPSLHRLADGVFAVVGSKLLDQSSWLLLLKAVLAAALLLGPTILMGGTLPLLAAWLQRNTPDAGRQSARFYSTNSLGAVCGAGLAGFVLVQSLGLPATMGVTALVNVIIGLVAIGIGRRPAAQFATGSQDAGTQGSVAPLHEPKLPLSPAQSGGEGVRRTGEEESSPASAPAAFRWGCVLVALTGAVSMGLEVLASRCLALILGASLQVFALVLMAFILGIGLGSAVIASPRRKHWSQENTTIALLLGAAVLIGLLVFNIENLAAIYSYAQSGLSRSPMGYYYHQVLVSVISICVLSLPAAALGSVLPLWIRISGSSSLLGEHVGRLLTWNTLGAVGGVLLTGFVLMPGIGLRGSFTTLAWVLIVVALVTALAARKRIAAVAAAVIAGLLVFVSVNGGEGWRYMLSLGVFRLPDGIYSPAFFQERRQSVKLVFYEDAADATVSVEQEALPGGITNLSLRINGKPDASVPTDLSTQVLLGQLPLMMKPDSKDVFVLGMGSGISAGTTLGYPIEQLTVADNCEPVLRAVKLFAPWNHGVFTNARTRIYHEDARTVLKLSPQKYDVIISEPSNPWMMGIGSVFNRQFYEIAASRLRPGGIMSQWLYTYELDDNIWELVVRTFGSVFPAMEIWDVGEGDVVLLGSDRPWKSNLEVYRRALELELPRRDLAAIGLTTPTAIFARQFASQRTAFALPGPGRIQSDNHPILEYEAPRGFYIYLGRGAQRFQAFDERTWQMGLATPEKNQALAELGLPSLGTIFGGVALSVNHDLQAFVRNRLGGGDGNLFFGNRIMPCIFQDAKAAALVFAPASMRTNAITQQLYNAEVLLRTDAAKQLQAVESIRDALAAVPTDRREKIDWSPAHYADLAIKAALRLGQPVLAKTILLRGLQLEPDSEELRYLARILVHEGILQSAEAARL